ncbi:MAG TPA: hypothetical protein VFO66_03475, partial [Gemmatimonadaceae bacterium]|nr:hypothetical protein [Gemmatimonadaceae bacterium]
LSGNTPTEGSDVVFTVTLSKQNVTGSAITFDLARSGGTSTVTDDHGAVTASISVANNQSAGTANVTTVDDALLELDETLQGTISNSSNADVTFVAAGVGTATINESGATATLSANSPTEGANMTFTVTLSKQNVTGGSLTFNFAKTAGSSIAADYGTVPTTIVVANTASAGSENITTVDDALLELDETFEGTITGPVTDVTIAAGGVATATINESGATATLSAVDAVEGANMVFTVTLSKTNVTGSAVSFTIAQTGGDPGDFDSFPATISVADLSAVGTANAATKIDATVEGNELITATITLPTNADVTIAGGGTASANILANVTEDDNLLQLSLVSAEEAAERRIGLPRQWLFLDRAA